MGFDGKTLIHPGQVEGANTAFAPSEQAVEDARGLIQAFEDGKGSGVVTYNGRMVENLHVESARRTLDIHEAIQALQALGMRAVVQRVLGASVTVDGEAVGAIEGAGLLVYLGVTHDDGPADVAWIARKVWDLRILRDEQSASDVARAGAGRQPVHVVRRRPQGPASHLAGRRARPGLRAAVRRGLHRAHAASAPTSRPASSAPTCRSPRSTTARSRWSSTALADVCRATCGVLTPLARDPSHDKRETKRHGGPRTYPAHHRTGREIPVLTTIGAILLVVGLVLNLVPIGGTRRRVF